MGSGIPGFPPPAALPGFFFESKLKIGYQIFCSEKNLIKDTFINVAECIEIDLEMMKYNYLFL